jgi:hypothetical protein
MPGASIFLEALPGSKTGPHSVPNPYPISLGCKDADDVMLVRCDGCDRKVYANLARFRM